MISKEFKFMGFECVAKRNIWGTWKFTGITYKNKGFKEEEYFSTFLNTYENKFNIALKEFQNVIINIVNYGITFKSNGMVKAYYLPSIKEVL